MPNPMARVRAFWISHGEWVLLGIVFALALNAGYGLAAYQFQKTVMSLQASYLAEIEGEKKYLRSVIEVKNGDIRKLQGIQGDLAKDASGTAKSSVDAVKALSETANTPKQ